MAKGTLMRVHEGGQTIRRAELRGSQPSISSRQLEGQTTRHMRRKQVERAKRRVSG